MTTTSAQIAGLFLNTAIVRIAKGGDKIAKQNLKNLGWASMYLSEKQLAWISGQVQRELRRNRQQEMALKVEVEGQVVGTWTIRENQISYTLDETYAEKVA